MSMVLDAQLETAAGGEFVAGTDMGDGSVVPAAVVALVPVGETVPAPLNNDDNRMPIDGWIHLSDLPALLTAIAEIRDAARPLGGSAVTAASDVSFTPTSPLTSTDVQAAITEFLTLALGSFGAIGGALVSQSTTIDSLNDRVGVIEDGRRRLLPTSVTDPQDLRGGDGPYDINHTFAQTVIRMSNADAFAVSGGGLRLGFTNPGAGYYTDHVIRIRNDDGATQPAIDWASYVTAGDTPPGAVNGLLIRAVITGTAGADPEVIVVYEQPIALT